MLLTILLIVLAIWLLPAALLLWLWRGQADRLQLVRRALAWPVLLVALGAWRRD